MIEELRIRGVGVIDEALLELSPGFTVITGETGAGKTMILNSLRLLMGERGDSDLVRSGHPRIEVDGIFRTSTGARATLRELGFEPDEEMILSRTVPASGRSRGIVDGRPVPLKVLGELVHPLVTIHGQSDQWTVRQQQVQRRILDRYAGASHLRRLDEYQDLWAEMADLAKDIDLIRSEHDQRQAEIEYLTGLVDAVDALELSPTEEEDLQAQIDRLDYVADLTQEVSEAAMWVQGREGVVGALDCVGTAENHLRQASQLDAELSGIETRLGQVEAELADIFEELRGYLDGLREDPDELARLQQRRADIESLMKGRATSMVELLRWQEASKLRLSELTGEGFDQVALQERLDEMTVRLDKLGADLHSSRIAAGKRLATAVNAELGSLAMKQASFQVHIESGPARAHGMDDVTMELRSRKDTPFRPLGEGASGGEISRIMLALEVALGEQSEPGTYVFDEVDQGVGGHTATEIGRRLAKLGENQQVIAVTHLPQVAAFASAHFVLQRDGSVTSVEPVHGEERVAEIVRMLGGDWESETARRHAEELLMSGSWQDRKGKKVLD